MKSIHGLLAPVFAGPVLAGPVLAGLVFLVPGLWPTAAGAQRTEVPPPPPIREPLPPAVQDPDEQIEPEVVIRREPGQTVEEYRSGGRVYMVRIVPVVGPAYYLVDTTGDGLLDLRHEEFNPVRPAHWRIFEW